MTRRKSTDASSPKVTFDAKPPAPIESILKNPAIMSEDTKMLGLVTSETVGAVIALAMTFAFPRTSQLYHVSISLLDGFADDYMSNAGKVVKATSDTLLDIDKIKTLSN